VPAWLVVLLFFVIGIFALLFRGRRVRLWLGDDHILRVESDGYRESYKRFRYQDIQFLTVRRTMDGKVMNAVLGFIIFAFAMLAWGRHCSGPRHHAAGDRRVVRRDPALQLPGRADLPVSFTDGGADRGVGFRSGG